MKKEKNEKKKKITYIITLIVLVLVIIGVSYAAFQFTGEGTKENVITAGSLKLTLEETNIITLANVYPMTDEEASSSGNLSNTFTLENTGSIPVTYELYLDDASVTGTRLDDKFIKYSMSKTGSSTGTVAPTYLTNRLIDSGTLPASGSITYNLKVWVTTEIDGDIGGQSWSAKLRVEAEQSQK